MYPFVHQLHCFNTDSYPETVNATVNEILFISNQLNALQKVGIVLLHTNNAPIQLDSEVYGSVSNMLLNLLSRSHIIFYLNRTNNRIPVVLERLLRNLFIAQQETIIIFTTTYKDKSTLTVHMSRTILEFEHKNTFQTVG